MQLSPLCFAVMGLAYVPPWSVNSGFVAGRDTTLVIDTGANALAAATIHGYASAVCPSNRIAVLNTEQHFDHIGGNGYFRDRGAEIHGHALIARTAQEFQREQAEFHSLISNATISNATRRERGEEHVFTPTNVSAWIPADRVLYCGDCLTHRYAPNLDCGTTSDWRQWLESLDRIERLHPRAIVPGHGPVAVDDDVPRVIQAVRRELELAIATGRSPTSI